MSQTALPNYYYHNNTPTTAPAYTNQMNWGQPQSMQQMPAQQQYQQTQQQPMQQQPQQPVIQSSRIYVQGEGAAKAYLVGKNVEQELWDSEAPVIYLKTVDAFGKPSMVIIDYKVRETKEETETNAISELRKEFDDLKSEMKNFMQSFHQNQQPQTKVYKTNYNKKEDK